MPDTLALPRPAGEDCVPLSPCVPPPAALVAAPKGFVLFVYFKANHFALD